MTGPNKTDPSAPLSIEVTRGGYIESRHKVRMVVTNTDGQIILQAGDINAVVFPRSAIKPIQALAFIESGAAEALQVSDSEVAVACGSHSGEPCHVAAVGTWLQRIGCSEADLECGIHLPYGSTATRNLHRAGQAPSPLHNNCSGKHAGFLTLARHLGWPTKGYIDIDHPVQKHVRKIFSSVCGLNLSKAPVGIDGCGIPTIAVPLFNLAMGMAHLASLTRPPGKPSSKLQNACARVRRAMTAAPFMIEGSDGFSTRMIDATHGRVLVKGGAEGVYAIALPETGFGAALKVEDGAMRAGPVAVGHLLKMLNILEEAETQALDDVLIPDISNRVGRVVGNIQPGS